MWCLATSHVSCAATFDSTSSFIIYLLQPSRNANAMSSNNAEGWHSGKQKKKTHSHKKPIDMPMPNPQPLSIYYYIFHAMTMYPPLPYGIDTECWPYCRVIKLPVVSLSPLLLSHRPVHCPHQALINRKRWLGWTFTLIGASSMFYYIIMMMIIYTYFLLQRCSFCIV